MKECTYEGLSCELIDSKPQDFDFSEGYMEHWEVPLVTSEEDEDRYMPMMNYMYPLGESFEVPDDFRAKLVNTTIIQMDDEYYLALTGGGMDMTWEICESFINLGYYPPVHFCRLPAMCGRGSRKFDRHIIAVCNESIRILIKWLEGRLKQNEQAFPAPCPDRAGASPQKTGCQGEKND
ncbi:hypothetical protein PDESU_02456 [Pontiella desulfatans]|uniref:Uncharacterized protein n=1 Tax=Pontiella desulfatans TaxID=2750659 RepID=A0A6C2U280_PONDE|nr:hypothetical protein [Pontiella desulfatans]VGO13899.1 hypothetical protein PDESU_02456 [Pontiella desulfatans]